MKDNFEGNVVYQPLKSRFYILFTLSLYTFLCGFLWNSWAPIMVSIKELYKWDLTTINLQSNLFSITFCVFIFPIVYLWNKQGIQLVYSISALLVLIGSVIRLYPSSVYVESILVQCGSAITGVGTTISLVAPPVISMLWFPSGERARATGTALSFNTLGTALSPITASYLVPVINGSHSHTHSLADINAGIKKYMFLECSLAVTVIVLILIYFPSKPPIPPCKSSDESLRLDFASGTKLLIKNKQFWIVFMVNMITYGFNSAVAAVAVTYTIPMGISQKECSILGFVANLMTFVSMIFGGWLGDKVSYKKIILASIPFNVILYTASGLQCLNIIPHDLTSVYILTVIQCLLTSFVCPASFEMGVEAAFPVSEEISTAAISFATNIGIVLYLSVCMIPNIGTIWIPFSYSVLSLFLLPLMWFYKDERNRMKYDTSLAEGDILEVDINNDTPSLSNEPLLLP